MGWDERRKKYVLAALVLFLAMAAIYFYTHRNVGAGNPQPAAPLVRVETLSRRDMKKRVVLSGETVARASVDISPKYAGRIASVEVELGDRVLPGEVLIRQDARDVGVSILQNHAQSREASAEAIVARATFGADILKAQTNFETAKATYERYQMLYDAGAVALQERDEKYRAMTEAQAVLAALTDQNVGGLSASVAAKEAAAAKAEYMVEALEIQREDLELKSPVAGVVGYRKAEAGEWATAGETLLMGVGTPDCLVEGVARGNGNGCFAGFDRKDGEGDRFFCRAGAGDGLAGVSRAAGAGGGGASVGAFRPRGNRGDDADADVFRPEGSRFQ